MFENWPYALMGISWYQDFPFVKINDLGDSIVLQKTPRSLTQGGFGHF